MSIESFRQVGNAADNLKFQTPVTLNRKQQAVASTFGTVKHLILDKFQTANQRELRNQKVKQAFMAAIKQEFGDTIEGLTKDKLADYKGKSLKIRDVRNMIDFADDMRMSTMSEPVKELLGPDDAEKCENNMKGTKSRKFMVDNKLTKNEMTALLCLTGIVENANVSPSKIKMAMLNKHHNLRPIANNMDSALSKLPPHKGTVYSARPLFDNESIKDFSILKNPKKSVNLLQVNETLHDKAREKFTAMEKSPKLVLTSYKSESGRLLQFGDKSIDKEFIVFAEGSILENTGVEQLGSAIKAKAKGKGKDANKMDSYQPGAIKVSFEEIIAEAAMGGSPSP